MGFTYHMKLCPNQLNQHPQHLLMDIVFQFSSCSSVAYLLCGGFLTDWSKLHALPILTSFLSCHKILWPVFVRNSSIVLHALVFLAMITPVIALRIFLKSSSTSFYRVWLESKHYNHMCFVLFFGRRNTSRPPAEWRQL